MFETTMADGTMADREMSGVFFLCAEVLGLPKSEAYFLG